MKLSIIIPVYNVEPYIEKCLESIYEQDISIDKYEVIIVNDGTKDNSMDIVDKYVLQYSNITIVNQINSGLSEARNAGLKIAKGDYVWFIDSDDWIEKNVLGNIYQLIEKYNADVYATPLNHIKEGTQIGHHDFTISGGILTEGKDYLFRKFPYGASPRFILKRSFLLANKLNFYPNLLHEDGEFGPKMLYLAKSIYIIPDSIYNYRLRTSESIMSSWKRRNSDDLVFIHKELEDFCEKSINNLEDKNNFKIIIFNTLRSSIFFAKKDWQTAEFKSFYNDYYKYIKRKALDNVSYFTIKHLGFKSFIGFFLLYINPFLFLKCRKNI